MGIVCSSGHFTWVRPAGSCLSSCIRKLDRKEAVVGSGTELFRATAVGKCGVHLVLLGQSRVLLFSMLYSGRQTVFGASIDDFCDPFSQGISHIHSPSVTKKNKQVRGDLSTL